VTTTQNFLFDLQRLLAKFQSFSVIVLKSEEFSHVVESIRKLVHDNIWVQALFGLEDG
jgi:hypothetical protein